MPLLPALVTALALALYLGTVIAVMRARGHYGIAAPATSGHPVFERLFRIQQNTLEQLVLFLPALWLASLYFTKVPLLPGALGLVWIVGRILYMQAYMADPDKRGLGFGIAAFASIALLLLAIVGIVMTWISAAPTTA